MYLSNFLILGVVAVKHITHFIIQEWSWSLGFKWIYVPDLVMFLRILNHPFAIPDQAPGTVEPIRSTHRNLSQG